MKYVYVARERLDIAMKYVYVARERFYITEKYRNICFDVLDIPMKDVYILMIWICMHA